MNDIYFDIKKWLNEGRKIALAIVIKTWGSSPREVGAKMAVTDQGEMIGSVSGGCVEGAVVEAALATIRSGESKYLHFGVADETAWEVGLACGGEIGVFVHPLDENLFESQISAFAAEKVYATLTHFLTDGGGLLQQDMWVEGQAGDGFDGMKPPQQWGEQAKKAFEAGKTGLLNISAGHDLYFLDVTHPQPQLIIIGGAHISIALVRIANTMGYRTIVVDPRGAFGSEARFTEADQLIQLWPDEALSGLEINRSSAIAVLSHDPKLDDPALIAALETNAFYVGALGSRGTQQKRRLRLLEAGLSEAQVDRIHGPIGLNLGGRSPEEIALAVMAEIVKVRHSAM